MDLSTKRIWKAEPDVIDQHDKDIGGVLLQPLRLLPPSHRRVLNRRPGNTCRGRRREREYGAVGCRLFLRILGKRIGKLTGGEIPTERTTSYDEYSRDEKSRMHVVALSTIKGRGKRVGNVPAH